jgi:hypothetical protein
MTFEQSLSGHYSEIRARLYGERVPAKPKPARRVAPVTSNYSYKIGPQMPEMLPGTKSWHGIVNEVTRRTGVTMREMRQSNKRPPVANVRLECYYRLRIGTGLSFSQIGAIFQRDHTTVLQGIQNYCRRNGVEYPCS